MADNSVTQKSPKSVESSKTKFGNVIQRTTSETLRLGETDPTAINLTGTSVSAPAITAAGQQRKKPCSSFQITSVVVGRNNDGGDDSADDLDESHADDISDVVDNSRITDNETPSYSEDTYSKEDVFYNVTSSSLCSAPVIPTSAQYGIAIVQPTILNNAGLVTVISTITSDVVTTTMNLNNNHPNILASTISSSNNNNSGRVDVPKADAIETSPRDTALNPGRNDRFKVVKIESTEPFKRGRWMCMDYLDHTMNQQFVQQQQHHQQQHQLQQQQLQQQQAQQHHYQVSSITDSLQNTYLHSDTNVVVMADNLQYNRQQSPLVQPAQPQMQPGAANTAQPQMQPPGYYNPGQHIAPNQQYPQYNNPIGGGIHTQVPTSYAPLQQQGLPQMSMVPTSSPTVYNQTGQHYTPTQTYMQSGQSYTNPQIYGSQQTAPIPTATPTKQPQPQQQHQQNYVPQGTGQAQSYAGPTQSSANVPTQGQSYAGQTSQIMSSGQGQGQSYSASQTGASQIQSFPRNYNSQTSVPMQPQPQQSYIPQSQMFAQPFSGGTASYSAPNPASQIQQQQQQQVYGQNIASSVSQTQNFVSMPSSPASVGQHPVYPAAAGSQSQVYTQPAQQQQQQQTQSQYAPLNVTSSTASMPYLSSGQSLNFIHSPQPNYPMYSQSQTSITSQTFAPLQVNSQSSCTLVYTNLQCSGSGTSQLEPSPSETSQQFVEPATSTSEPTTNAEEPTPTSGPEESESATGNSAVAIDNKIEQAMDLVKSHLMFAVREEVEVLKEKIAELMDRINQLETENSILKANASQETLAQLAAPSQAAAAAALLNATATAAAAMTAVTGGVFTASTASSHTNQNQVSPGSAPGASGGSN